MKVNEKIISIPPFISTHWNNVAAIHMKGSILLVSLHDGDTISIPNLPAEAVEAIFQFHGQHLEEEAALPAIQENGSHVGADGGVLEQILELPFRIGVSTMDGLSTSIMQHSSQQSDMPDFPREFLDKIGEVITAIAGEDVMQQLKPEPHCNCPHCQVARSLLKEEAAGDESSSYEDDTEVGDEELQFREWDIEQKGENLYQVTHRLDKETYNVHLGTPIGCTCGQSHCPHIEAVLKS